METTPLDIRKQEFGRQLRGYNRTEVDTFLEMVAKEMENLTRKKNELEEKIEQLNDRLENYKNIETTLQSTLLTSQKQAEAVVKNAEERAELILRRAKMESEKFYERAYQELGALRAEIGKLQGLKEAFAARLRSLLDTHGRLIEEVMKGESHPTGKVTPKKALMSEEEIERAVEEFKTQSFAETSQTESGEQPPPKR